MNTHIAINAITKVQMHHRKNTYCLKESIPNN